MPTTTITLSFKRPPLTANDRHGWQQKAGITKQVRQEAFWRARAARLPKNLAHAEVGLTWVPCDRRRRDVDNIVPTLKALCDGLVDFGLVPDDTPEYMTKHMPTITAPDGNPRMALTITWKQP